MAKRALELCPVVVDTREQTPWTFDANQTVTTLRALPSGDYSISGMETSVAVERKSLNDFVNSISGDNRERFMREMERLRSYEFKAVVVEASLSKVANGEYHSRMHPSSVIGTAISLKVDFGIDVMWLDSHGYAARYVEKTLRRIWLNAKQEAKRAEMELPPETGE